MKKKKLKLDELNVKSFVPELSNNEKQTLDGGFTSGLVISVEIIGSIIIGSILLGSCTCNNGATACPPQPPKPPRGIDNEIQCSAYRRGSCGGTIGA